MLANYWGVRTLPFENSQNPQWYYESESHTEALARLFFVIEANRPCVILSGAKGTGKSLLLRILSSQAQRTQRKVASLDLYGLTGEELLWQLTSILQLSPSPTASLAQLWRTLSDGLKAKQLEQIPLVLVMDHLDKASECCIAQLERLLQTSVSCRPKRDTKNLTTLVAAMDDLSALNRIPLVKSMTELRVELEPWTPEELIDYVQQTWQRAGGTSHPFAPSALATLYDLSQGNPQEANRLAHLSLLAATGDDETVITSELLHNVSSQLIPHSINEESAF